LARGRYAATVLDEEEFWWRVRPPHSVNGDLTQVLASVDSLQRAWADVVRDETSEEFQESRRRNLRRHAIETGIIERLYDVGWGVTEALVAEGLSTDVAEREGGIDEDALATIKAQFDALGFLAEAAGQTRLLSVQFIRELHAALCRTQLTYTALDQFNRPVVRQLRHGAWKELPNRAHTRAGEIMEFAPPEQVASEIDRLVALDASAEGLHPLISAAWLHHSFVAIHPFDDGNGRVARALSLLVLLRNRYAPLVVDRYSRPEYLAALETANTGDLRGLVRLFARLEVVALRAELERPVTAASARDSSAVDVARAYVQRLQVLRSERALDLAASVAILAADMSHHVAEHLRALGEQLVEQFSVIDPTASFDVFQAAPPDERSRWWRAQIIRTARRGGFFANLTGGTWWTYLRLTTLGQQLRFVAVSQKVGHGETGVLVLTVFAEAVQVTPTLEAGSPGYVTLINTDDDDSITIVAGEPLEARLNEIYAVVDRNLAAAVARFAEGLD
jgi:Fic family protein